VDQSSGGLTGRILERAAEAPLLDRLGRPPVRLHLQQSGSHELRRLARRAEARRNDRPTITRRLEHRVPVAKGALLGGHRVPLTMLVDHLSAQQAALDLAAESPGISKDRATHRPRPARGSSGRDRQSDTSCAAPAARAPGRRDTKPARRQATGERSRTSAVLSITPSKSRTDMKMMTSPGRAAEASR